MFVHVYVHHFDRMMAIGKELANQHQVKPKIKLLITGAEPHVNTCYKHFYYFVTEFSLLHDKEFEPLKEMTQRICTDLPQSPNIQASSSASKSNKNILPSTIEESEASKN